MSATLTATIERSLTISPRLLACQGEMAVSLTVNVDADIQTLASGKNAYLYFLLPNGDAFYKGEYDASSGSFGVTLGFTDHVLSYAGEAFVQLVIADDEPSDATEMWKTEMCAFVIAPSISAVLPASYYTVPTVTVPTTFPAENTVIGDASDFFASANVEDALQEVGLTTTGQNPLDANFISINHRGYSTAPENTLPAYVLSKKMGFNYVECDVRFTSDGIAVLLHDPTIDRTSDGTGNVADLTFAQLLTYDFGSWKSAVYAGTRIPTFEQFIILCKKLNLRPWIELKISMSEAQVTELMEIVEKHTMLDKVVWFSFYAECIPFVISSNASANVGLAIEAYTTDILDTLATATSGTTGSVYIVPYAPNVTTDLHSYANTKGIETVPWGVVTSASVIVFAEIGIRGVIVDSLNVARVLADSALQTAPITNLVENSNLASGDLTKWTNITIPESVEYSATGRSSGSIKITAVANAPMEHQVIGITAEHIYYVGVWRNVESGSIGTSGIYLASINGGTGYLTVPQSSTTTGGWYRHGTTYTATTTRNEYLQFGRATAATYVAHFADALIVDLTLAFGAGNEPTKTEFETMLTVFSNQWFNGTVVIGI